jgi:hypothetical protein
LNDYPSATSINIRVQLTFTHHLGQPFFITVPVLLDDNAFKANTFVRNAPKFLPTFYLDLDSAAQNPDDPMMKLFDLMTASADDVSRLYVDYFDYELTEIAPGEDGTEEWARSKLTDPDYAEVENLEWLAQFSGVNLRSSVLYEQPSVTAFPDTPTSIVNQYYEGEGFYIPVTNSLVNTEYGGSVDGWTALSGFLDGTNIDLTAVKLSNVTYSDYQGSFLWYFTLNFEAGKYPLNSLTAANIPNASISWKDPDTKETFRIGCILRVNELNETLGFEVPYYDSEYYRIHLNPDSSLHSEHFRLCEAMKKLYDNTHEGFIWDEDERQEEAGFTITLFPGGDTAGDKALLMWFGDGDLNVDFYNWLSSHIDGGVFYVRNGFTNYWTKIYFTGRFHIADPQGLTTNGETLLVFYDTMSPTREPTYFIDPDNTTVYANTSISFDDDDLTVVSKYPTDEESEQFKRWQISSKYTGINSGSREAITESVRLGLTGDKVVAISPNYNTKDWRIHIRTLTSETPTDPLHPITGQSAEIVALAELAKPVGFYITHNIVDKLFFTLNNVGIGRLNISVLGDETFDPSGGGSTAIEDII